MKNTRKGRYKPTNPDKYKGDVNNIIYRSSWERDVMQFLDHTDSILKWNSEGVVIPYVCKTDNKWHRYYVDFWVRARQHDGTIEEYLLEVKPQSQIEPPKRTSKNLQEDVRVYLKNQSKWDYAQKWAQQHNMKFKLVNEETLGRKKKPARKRVKK